MRTRVFFSVLVLAGLMIAGCGADPSKKSGSKNSKTPETSDSKEKKASAGQGPGSGNSSTAEKIVSNLPFGDVDPAKAERGIEPGRMIIDAEGVDSSGKKISLSDYRGKVILLDTWASW